jgi:hypothetical protein
MLEDNIYAGLVKPLIIYKIFHNISCTLSLGKFHRAASVII